jgi:hypothetical protein
VYSIYRWDCGPPELPPILAPAIGYRALGVAPPSVATASFTPAGHNRRCWFGRGSDGFRPNGWIFAGCEVFLRFVSIPPESGRRCNP